MFCPFISTHCLEFHYRTIYGLIGIVCEFAKFDLFHQFRSMRIQFFFRSFNEAYSMMYTCSPFSFIYRYFITDKLSHRSTKLRLFAETECTVHLLNTRIWRRLPKKRRVKSMVRSIEIKWCVKKMLNFTVRPILHCSLLIIMNDPECTIVVGIVYYLLDFVSFDGR